jgi:hypothetical protein
MGECFWIRTRLSFPETLPLKFLAGQDRLVEPIIVGGSTPPSGRGSGDDDDSGGNGNGSSGGNYN